MAKSNHLMAMMSLWGIILVVLGHSGFEDPFIAEKLRWLDTWIYMFHMPLFFFISGYLYSLTNRDFSEIYSSLCTIFGIGTYSFLYQIRYGRYNGSIKVVLRS